MELRAYHGMARGGSSSFSAQAMTAPTSLMAASAAAAAATSSISSSSSSLGGATMLRRRYQSKLQQQPTNVDNTSATQLNLMMSASDPFDSNRKNVKKSRSIRSNSFRPKTVRRSSTQVCENPFCDDCPPFDMAYCTVINSSSNRQDGSENDSFDGDYNDASSISSSGSSSAASSTPTASFVYRSPLFFRGGASAADPGSLNDSNNSSNGRELASWKERLLKVSNWASFLCVLDCTILPIITLVLPLFGLVTASPAQTEWLHELGHAIALFFVLPVGGTATTLNYMFAHRKSNIAALGWFGLTLIGIANSGAGCGHAHHAHAHAHHHVHEHVHHAAETVFSVVLESVKGTVHTVLDTLSHGVAHRAANLSGCALLMLSNWLSRREHEKSHTHHGGSSCCSNKHCNNNA